MYFANFCKYIAIRRLYEIYTCLCMHVCSACNVCSVLYVLYVMYVCNVCMYACMHVCNVISCHVMSCHVCMYVYM